MIYIRGHRRDFDGWAAAGNPGWSYEEVLPYFKRSENFEPGADRLHGAGGPLNVTRLRDTNPASLAFVEAAAEAGLARNEDFNGARQTGAGLYHVTQKRGKRCSSAGAFLRPALKRPNLTVETEALVTRVLVEKDRAAGVRYRKNGGKHEARAGQVILAGGAINSPQLLLLSGIGPAADLERLGIDVALDLPGVGENLHDHPIVLVCFDCKQPVTLADGESLGSLARFLLFKRGHLTSNVGETGGFTRILAGDDEAPDLQFHFAPGFFVNHGFDNPEGHGLSLGPTLVRPRSRGRLWLTSDDPTVPPAIDPRYLDDPADREILGAGVELAREIMGRPALSEFVGDERFPGADVTGAAALDDHIRRETYTLYHPVGTCKMGTDDLAVVDSELRVRGVEGLRVVDASIMPTITNGNTNAPTIMIAEKAADMIQSTVGQ